MAFNINELRSQLTYGGARGTLFQVQITNPINSIADIKIPMMVKAATLPPSVIGTIEVPYFGRKIKEPGDRVFEPWTVSIINDEDFPIRNSIESWMSAINSHQGNITSALTPLSLKSQAQVTQFSKSGIPVRTYTMNGIFPVELGAIQVSWEDTDRIEEFEVTFQYDWWEVSGGVTGDGGTTV